MAFKITTISIFKNTLRGTGGTSLSDPIEMRAYAEDLACALTYTHASTGGATCGSGLYSYQVSATIDGTYQDAGTFGTTGATPGSGIFSFTSVVAPWMKIKFVAGTSAAVNLTGDLHIR